MDYEDEDDAPAAYLGAMEQREKDELEFYTDLAVQEMQRWVEAVTRKSFKYPEDPKSSLANGVLLCELLNGIQPGTVKRINRLPSSMAGMDNLNVFIDACKIHFGLKEAQLFTPSDLQDFAAQARDVELAPAQLKESEDKKIRNVAITVFWLARQVQGIYAVPTIDFTNFTSLVNAKTLNSSLGSTGQFYHQHQYSSSGDWTEPDSVHSAHYKHSRASSRDSSEYVMRRGGADRREGRYSSSDSLDDLDRPGSQNSGYGVRRTSSNQPDPLQFIALKPADELAQKAARQLILAQETKKKRESVDKDEAEWQFQDDSWKENLSSWKQRRKSKGSSAAPEREANEMVADHPKQFERSHKKGQGHQYSQSQSSQSYEEDEAFDSPTSHQKRESDVSSPRDKHTPGSSPRDEHTPGSSPRDEHTPGSSPRVEHTPGSSPRDEHTPGSFPRDEHTPGSTKEFKPFTDDYNSGSAVEDIIERATIKPVESQPQQTASLRSTSGSAQYSMVKNKMRVKLITETGCDDGFGFTIKGGRDKCLPITIESISNHSVADKAELLEGDELLEINEEIVTDRNRGYCMLLINESLQKNGKLDLYIKRDYTKVPAGAKERKQSSNVAPKSILDIYDSLETKETADDSDGQMISKGKDLDKMEDEMTRREMEREYRQILDGGYDSAVSTLKSELTMDDRQAYLDNQQEKITATVVHAAYMSPPSEYISPQEYEERETTPGESYPRLQSSASPFTESRVDSEDMEQFEQMHEKVSKDFEEVTVPLISADDVRLEKRSEKLEDNRKRMEEWQKQQDLRQQELYEKGQKEMQRQVEKSRQEAEEFEKSKKLTEQGTKERTVQRLLEIKARYSLDNENNDYLTSNKQAEADNESIDEDDDLAKYRIKPAEKSNSDEMKDRYTLNYQDFKSTDSVPKETPYLSDVYKYYDEDLPANFGERDPSPPPMSRKDVMSMNKKSTPWKDANELPAESGVMWERKEVIAPVNEKVVPPWKRPNANKVLDDRRKSAPTKSSWMNEDSVQSSAQRSTEKESDVDPNLPSTLRKEDVLKMTREKARFSAQSRRSSDAPVKSQPINHKTMNAVPVPIRKGISDWVKVQPESDSPQGEGVQGNNPHRNSMGFFSNRAMFEQQSREADRYWADQSKDVKKQPAKQKPLAMRKAMSTVQAPSLKKDMRSKSMDVRSQLNRGDIVRSADASDAAYERMKELAQMKTLREQEAIKAEEDERERRNRERRVRDERQRELAEIRRMNQQYEAAALEQQQTSPQSTSSRSDELEMARRRMAREAEELARAQMRHDEDVKTIHGVDMQEERRRREIEHSRYVRGEEDSRHSRELGDLDRDEQVDAMSRRRHQEMLEQSRRDKQRREEAQSLEQQKRNQPAHKHPQQLHHSQQQRSQSTQMHPQQLHHSQQKQQEEWRPQPEEIYSKETQPTYSSKPITNRLGSPQREQPRANNHTISPADSNPRYEANYSYPSNGYGQSAENSRRESNNKSPIYQKPLPGQNAINPQLSRDEGRNEIIYGVPHEAKSLIKPQVQSTQSSAPPMYQPPSSADWSAPKSYERQQPIGHNANRVHQDSFDRDIPAPKPFDRLSSDHRRQDSYDRNNMYSGYSSSNDGYNDSSRPYSNEKGGMPGYSKPDPSQLPSRIEDPRYQHHHKNGSSSNSHNNNDIYKRSSYSKERSPESSLAPSKPPRSQTNGGEEGDVVTVSAKYSCAYCTKELGKGAAMVIESLGLYYHVECFRCCVCHSLLSNGQMGADVRVRVNRLHCKNCYSNDDAVQKYLYL